MMMSLAVVVFLASLYLYKSAEYEHDLLAVGCGIIAAALMIGLAVLGKG